MDALPVDRAADADFQRRFDGKHVRFNLRLGARYAVHFHRGDARIIGFELDSRAGLIQAAYHADTCELMKRPGSFRSNRP